MATDMSARYWHVVTPSDFLPQAKRLVDSVDEADLDVVLNAIGYMAIDPKGERLAATYRDGSWFAHVAGFTIEYVINEGQHTVVVVGIYPPAFLRTVARRHHLRFV
jgi:hypothetical protein